MALRLDAAVAAPRRPRRLKPPFHRPDAVAIGEQRIALYIYGLIEYVDDYSFAGTRATGFCYVYNPRDRWPGNFDVCAETAYTYVR